MNAGELERLVTASMVPSAPPDARWEFLNEQVMRLVDEKGRVYCSMQTDEWHRMRDRLTEAGAIDVQPPPPLWAPELAHRNVRKVLRSRIGVTFLAPVLGFLWLSENAYPETEEEAA